MKPVDQWGKDEYVWAALMGLVAVMAYRAARGWWVHRGPVWLRSHHVLMPAGRGLVNLGRMGALDVPRLLSVVVVLYLVRLLVVSVVLPMAERAAVRKALSQKAAQQKLTQLQG